MHLCVCMYVCMYVYAYHTHTHTHLPLELQALIRSESVSLSNDWNDVDLRKTANQETDITHTHTPHVYINIHTTCCTNMTLGPEGI